MKTVTNIDNLSEEIATDQEKTKDVRAGRSAWYDRHVGIVEVAGSNPAPSTTELLKLKSNAVHLELWLGF